MLYRTSSVIACALLLTLVSSAHGRPIWVDESALPRGDGSALHPFTRISEGIAAANASTDVRGVQVRVRPGAYLDEDLPILITRPRTQLVNVGEGAALIVPPADFDGIAIYIAASRVVVAGFDFAGPGFMAVAARGTPDAPIFRVGIVNNHSEGYFGGAHAESASGWIVGNTFIGGHLGILVTGSDSVKGGASWRISGNHCVDNDIGMCFIAGLDPSDYFDGMTSGGPIQVAGAVDAEVFDNVIEGQRDVALNILYRGIFPIIDQPVELSLDFHDNVVAQEPGVMDISVANIQAFFLGECPEEQGAPGSADLALADNEWNGPAAAELELAVFAAYGSILCGPMASGSTLTVWDPDGSLAPDYEVYNPPEAGNEVTVNGP